MIDYVAPMHMTQQRAASLLRWAAFGVFLPLLPIVANIAARWVAASQDHVTFTVLFSDGELLVLATVISAAGVGDLVLDLVREGGRRGKSALRIAASAILALIVVVLSVLFYGLVSYNTRSHSSRDSDSLAASSALNTQANVLQSQLNTASATANLYQHYYLDEVAGVKCPLCTGVPGESAQALALKDQYESAARQVSSLSKQIEDLRVQAVDLAQHSATIVTSGTSQAADLSVVMFCVSVLVGLNCVYAGTASGVEEGEEEHSPRRS